MAWYTTALIGYKKKVDTGWRIRKNGFIIGIWEVSIVSNVKTKTSYTIVKSAIGASDGKVIAAFDTLEEVHQYLRQEYN